MYTFLCIFAILLVLYVLADQFKTEPFVGEVPLNTKSEVKIPDAMKEPAVTELPVSEEAEPSDFPGPLPVAPYQQVFRNSPTVYQDPSLIRTTRPRILELLERVKGFLAFQAQEIEDRSDPAIQLPLQTVRGDFKRLESEANVLQRNPGIQPQMTELDIAQVDDNLSYLQREVELIGSNRPFQSSAHDLDLEGFVGSPTEGAATETASKKSSPPATAEELKNFSIRLDTEIKRLSASATNDPTTNARISNLTKMKADVDQILTNLTGKKLLPSEVPITSAAIEAALPALGDISQPLPQILDQYNLPAGISNLLPTGVANDPESKRQINGLINKYAKDFFQGASGSMTFNVNYVSPRQVELANAQSSTLDLNDYYGNDDDSTIANTGFPSASDLDRVGRDPSLTEMDAPDQMTDPWAQDIRAEGRTPATGEKGKISHFNWEKRVKEIVNQIKLRGMKLKDFGVDLDALAVPSKQFSWKGFAKMMCTRLQTVDVARMDEMCGCPPMNWKGWNA